jgi:hypothetical protein
MQPDPTDAQVETPLDDALEQAEPAVPSDNAGEESMDEVAEATVHRGMEVGEWDASEQARTVTIEDDDR